MDRNEMVRQIEEVVKQLEDDVGRVVDVNLYCPYSALPSKFKFVILGKNQNWRYLFAKETAEHVLDDNSTYNGVMAFPTVIDYKDGLYEIRSSCAFVEYFDGNTELDKVWRNRHK